METTEQQFKWTLRADFFSEHEQSKDVFDEAREALEGTVIKDNQLLYGKGTLCVYNAQPHDYQFPFIEYTKQFIAEQQDKNTAPLSIKEWYKTINFDTKIDNPLENPNAFIVQMVTAGIFTILNEAKISDLDDSWQNIQFTNEKIQKILAITQSLTFD